MSKPETIKDLEIAGAFSKTDGRALASEFLSGYGGVFYSEVASLQGYEIAMPKFEDLDQGLQGYLVKVVIEATVTNVLDAADEDAELDADYDAAMAKDD
jgi:hypothetical protein